MLNREQVERAVDLQQRAFDLLKWLTSRVASQDVGPKDARAYGSLEESASSWISANYEELPSYCRPATGDVGDFSRFFSTYLVNSFDLDPAPGQRRFGALPYDPFDSWLVELPQLRAKRVDAAGREVTQRLRHAALLSVAHDAGVDCADSLAELLADRRLRPLVGLVAYAEDLLQRLRGTAVGTASLVLWRSFAWNETGAPKPGFVLTAASIMDAEAELRRHLQLTCPPVATNMA